jgi:hypothetical protein
MADHKGEVRNLILAIEDEVEQELARTRRQRLAEFTGEDKAAFDMNEAKLFTRELIIRTLESLRGDAV